MTRIPRRPLRRPLRRRRRASDMEALIAGPCWDGCAQQEAIRADVAEEIAQGIERMGRELELSLGGSENERMAGPVVGLRYAADEARRLRVPFTLRGTCASDDTPNPGGA